MDVDSDDDNVTKQKKATEKFMALLKPIKDAALAFDVDVDEALEDYVEACVRYVEKDAGAMINFAEAGLLLQGSAVVYGRKVDGVHALVYRVLELLRTGQKEKEKAEKKAAVRSRRPTSVPSLQYDSCPSHDDVGGFFFEFECSAQVQKASEGSLRYACLCRAGDHQRKTVRPRGGHVVLRRHRLHTAGRLSALR